MAAQVPAPSHLSKTTTDVRQDPQLQHPAEHLLELAAQIQHNLQNQHDWTDVLIHTRSPLNGSTLERPLISGKPPRRVYIHPDELLEFIKAGVKDEDIPSQREWVLPSHLKEKWSLRGFAAIFDNLSRVPPTKHEQSQNPIIEDETNQERNVKRILLGTVDDDSTIVYYIMHDGIVKPRQN